MKMFLSNQARTVLVPISSSIGPGPNFVLIRSSSLSFNIFLVLVRSSSLPNLKNSSSSSLVPGTNWDEDGPRTTRPVPRTPGAAICSGPMKITPVDDLGSEFSQVTIITVKFTSLLWRIFKLMSNQNSVSELDLNQSEQSTLTIWKPFLNDHYRRFHVTHCQVLVIYEHNIILQWFCSRYHFKSFSIESIRSYDMNNMIWVISQKYSVATLGQRWGISL